LNKKVEMIIFKSILFIL